MYTTAIYHYLVDVLHWHYGWHVWHAFYIRVQHGHLHESKIVKVVLGVLKRAGIG
jgi:hypothetical protein